MKQRIADMYVQCSLQVRNHNRPGIAMSDCCGAPAVAAVVMGNGSKMWRCYTHKSIRRMETGEWVAAIERISDEF